MKSMTGHGRGECAHDGFKIAVEVSSVNRKQSDITVDLPRNLAVLESSVRDLIHQAASRGRITGREAAHAVMESAGIRDVEIVMVPGQLTDHYDPLHKRLALSQQNYHGTSLAALGVAAHEAGHAIQHKVGYAMMKFRQVLVPATQISAGASQFLIIAGILLGAKGLGGIFLTIGAVALAVWVPLLVSLRA